MDKDINEIKHSVDRILKIVEDQANKQEHSELLIHVLSSKVDVQNERLKILEKEVRSVKETITQHNPKEQIHPNKHEQTFDSSVRDKHRKVFQSEFKDNTTATAAGYFNNDNNTVSQFSKEIIEVKTLVREEARGLGNICIRCSTDVTMRLDQADKMVFTPLLEATSDLKHVLQRLDDLERGVTTVENVTNRFSLILDDLKEDAAAKDGLLKEIKINTENHISISKAKTDELMEKLDVFEQLTKAHSKNVTDELMEKLDALEQTTKAHSKGGTVVKRGSHDKKTVNTDVNMTRQYREVIEHIIAENQITRDIVQNTRKPRGIYTCDFFLPDFIQHINSGNRDHYSNFWYIDQIKTHLRGFVIFGTDGKLDIWLVHGNSPKKCGLDEKAGKDVRVKVSAVVLSKQDWELGTVNMDTDESTIRAAVDGWVSPFGRHVTTVPCEEFTRKGYIDKWDRLLLRYTITPK